MSETVDNATRRSLFLRSSVPDFLLVLVVSVALSQTVCFGFNVNEHLARLVPLNLVVAAPMLAALFAGTWSKGAIAPSAVAAAVVLVAAIAVGVATSGADFLEDDPGNNVILMTIWAVVPLVVFLLSRRPVGLAFLLVASIVTCGFIQFLYQGMLMGQFVVALVGVMVLFVYQTYKQSVRTAKRAKRAAFGGALGFSALVGVVCVALGAAVYFGVIEPLNPGAQELKPFQEYYALETIEYTGVYQEDSTTDPDKTTEQTDDRQAETNDSDAAGGDSSPEDRDEGSSPNLLEQLASAFDASQWHSDYDVQYYQMLRLGFLLFVALVVLAIVGAVLFQISRRKRRLRKLGKIEPAGRVMELYRFFESRLGRMGLKRDPSMTPGEYSMSSYRSMLPFARDTDGVNYVRVTELFYRACYGHKPVTEEEYKEVVAFYEPFFKNARRYVGWPKWLLWKFWRI